jgi:copper resistance protein C
MPQRSFPVIFAPSFLVALKLRLSYMRPKLAILLALLAVAFFASTASGHDVLIKIDPSDGAVVSESQFQATLVFNNPLVVIAGESNAELATKLTGQTNWISHEVSIEGATLKADICLTQPGNYELRWKVVSSDGHQISGESSFVLEIEPVAESNQCEQVSEIKASAPQEGSMTGFYIGLAMVFLGAVFAPVGMIIRRRAKKS